jgi:integrase
MNELVLIAARTTLPAIIAAAGERLPGILRGEYPQPAHAPRLQPRRRGIYDLVRRQRVDIDHRRAAASRLGLDRAADASMRHRQPSCAWRRCAICSTGFVTGQVMPTNPAGSVRGPSHSPKIGRTAVLAPEEARALIDSIGITTPAGLRDRALIGLMVFSFARIGAALGMKVEDVFTQNRRLWVRLREKGGKPHAMPCHHNLETYLSAYIEGAGIADDPKGPLFRTIGRGTGLLTRTPLPQRNAYAMVGRRAAAAGIATRLGNHSFRATGITAYLKNGGTLEKAAQMANHASTRTTQLYDRRREELSLDEVERIRV